MTDELTFGVEEDDFLEMRVFFDVFGGDEHNGIGLEGWILWERKTAQR